MCCCDPPDHNGCLQGYAVQRLVRVKLFLHCAARLPGKIDGKRVSFSPCLPWRCSALKVISGRGYSLVQRLWHEDYFGDRLIEQGHFIAIILFIDQFTAKGGQAGNQPSARTSQPLAGRAHNRCPVQVRCASWSVANSRYA